MQIQAIDKANNNNQYLKKTSIQANKGSEGNAFVLLDADGGNNKKVRRAH